MSVPIKKWNGTKARVEKLLREHPNMRDDLDVIILSIWTDELQKHYNKSSSLLMYSDFINAMLSEKLTPPETIRRTWQKLQEKNPSLQGLKYAERHKTGKEATQEIVNE